MQLLETVSEGKKTRSEAHKLKPRKPQKEHLLLEEMLFAGLKLAATYRRIPIGIRNHQERTFAQASSETGAVQRPALAGQSPFQTREA